MIVGLTGGMACGKSTAAEIFREEGFETVDCDDLVRELLAGNREVQGAVRERFGESVMDPSGGVDRRALARIVFASPPDLEWLEGLLHPKVNRSWQELTESRPGIRWVVQIPLLFEKKLEKLVDLTVCVACSPQVQGDRLRRRGLTENQAGARLSRQLPLETKMEFSDYVILNDGSARFLRDQVLDLIRCIASE